MRPTPTEPNADSSAGENTNGLRQERDALQQERDSLFDRLARTTAEFQNARRRLEADKDQAVAFANTSESSARAMSCFREARLSRKERFSESSQSESDRRRDDSRDSRTDSCGH